MRAEWGGDGERPVATTQGMGKVRAAMATGGGSSDTRGWWRLR